MAEYKGVLIYGEVVEGRIASITKELLGIGRRLASVVDEKLSALLIGNVMGEAAKEAIAFGADEVYVVDQPFLATYHSDSYTAVATEVCQRTTPFIFLLGQADIGRDIGPRIAARLMTSLSTDCIDLQIEPDTKLLIQTRPVYGGNAIATLVYRSARIQMATVRPKSFSSLNRDDSRSGTITPMEIEIDASIIKTKLIERIKSEGEGIKLEDAEIIVTGGRGIGGADGFNLLRGLAKVLVGAVGATRIPCEEGWVSSSLEIGQTGKIVAPELYIAVALSGASQHLAGCLGARYIVAINNNPDANIFKVADFGIVGDYRQAVPVLTEKCRELLTR